MPYSKEVSYSRAAVNSCAGCRLHKSGRCHTPGSPREGHSRGCSVPSQRGPTSGAREILFTVVNLTARLLCAPVPSPGQLPHTGPVTCQVRRALIHPALTHKSPLLPPPSYPASCFPQKTDGVTWKQHRQGCSGGHSPSAPLPGAGTGSSTEGTAVLGTR